MRTGERRWALVRSFYRSYRGFHAINEQYERRVESLATRYGKDRRDLKVSPDELLSLFDSEALASLHDQGLETLRDVAQQLFRGISAPDPFNSQLTSIYHEVSLLKEEHWTIREDVMRRDRKAYERYYREVNVYYPRRLRHVRDLFGKARRRLEHDLLPQFARSKVIVRSVYLFGDRLVRGVYDDGLHALYGHMYPNGSALTGFTLAADSFAEGGFASEAVEAYDRAIAILDAGLAAGLAAVEDDAAPDPAPDADERERRVAQRRSLSRRRERVLGAGGRV